MHLLARSRSLSFRIGGRVRKVRRLSRTAPLMTFIICTNPRSGSWLLSDGLASSGLAGNPREWFNPIVEQKRRAEWRAAHSKDLTDAEYLEQVLTLGATPNGVCGVKLHYYQFDELIKKMMAGVERGKRPADLIAAALPRVKYIWLTRRDKARQAISYQLACVTGKWWLIDGAERHNDEAKLGEPDFDPYALARLEHTLTENDLKWQAFFSDNGIVPLVVFYEDLASDYSGIVRRILKWLGVRGADAVAIRSSRFRPQSGALNEQWLQRYTAFKADGGYLAQLQSPVDLRSPLAERPRKPLDEIPDSWKQWIAQNKRLKTPDKDIIEVLASNGYSRQLAIAEVARTRALD